jgi:hypothetical protein
MNKDNKLNEQELDYLIMILEQKLDDAKENVLSSQAFTERKFECHNRYYMLYDLLNKIKKFKKELNNI